MAAPELAAHKETHIYRLRHSLAHVLAQAILKIRPKAKLGFGPPVDEGFYYDFDFGDEPVSSTEFKEIEKLMRKIIAEKQTFEREYMTRDQAIETLQETDQSYKIEHINHLVDSGRADENSIQFYRNGPFLDLCEGPHLEHTGDIPPTCFSLDRISGSYWRGDEKNPMLTRIYGLAFESKEELKEYKKMREIAMQREHRKLGKELDIFVLDEEVGPGLPLWLPNGTIIRDEIEKYAREMEFRAGYQRVSTPVLTKSDLYYRSGHLPHYKESMYPPMVIDEGDEYYIRPMNCPHHHRIYSARPRSYRDLPVRLAEYGNTYRYEKHGSLSGLLRVRAMSMNDAHIYCTEEQIEDEFRGVISMYRDYYDHLGLGNFRVRLSLHDPEKDKYVANEESWLRSEEIVRQVLRNLNVDFEEEQGEAAFYGPKIDIQVKNVMGREETVSTAQLDFVMPERFELTYRDADGAEKRPLIIHRAPLSTHERLIAFLIELYGGAFPTWMAPVQAMMLPISETFADYAHSLANQLRENLIRAEVDDSAESLNKRIRLASKAKYPNVWIVGEKERDEGKVTWRRYCDQNNQFAVSSDSALVALKTMIEERMMDNKLENFPSSLLES